MKDGTYGIPTYKRSCGCVVVDKPDGETIKTCKGCALGLTAYADQQALERAMGRVHPERIHKPPDGLGTGANVKRHQLHEIPDRALRGAVNTYAHRAWDWENKYRVAHKMLTEASQMASALTGGSHRLACDWAMSDLQKLASKLSFDVTVLGPILDINPLLPVDTTLWP